LRNGPVSDLPPRNPLTSRPRHAGGAMGWTPAESLVTWLRVADAEADEAAVERVLCAALRLDVAGCVGCWPAGERRLPSRERGTRRGVCRVVSTTQRYTRRTLQERFSVIGVSLYHDT
jgi:hypothetical protein